jgi:ribosomal protein L29
MRLDETTLIEIQDYINELDKKIGLKPETMEDVRKAIDKHRTELKNLRLVAVSRQLVCSHEKIEHIDNFSDRMECVSCGKSF